MEGQAGAPDAAAPPADSQQPPVAAAEGALEATAAASGEAPAAAPAAEDADNGTPSGTPTTEGGAALRRPPGVMSEAGLPPLHKQSSNMASKIAAFASGVAPVRKGITNADEDSITVEEVLHKLETASRTNGQAAVQLPAPLVRSAHVALVAARAEAARVSKELAELKASRVQHIPPSTWIKREQKYKMDQEKYEHVIAQLRGRTERLERELAVLHEGSNVKPLEERIQELEHQLLEAAQEKTQVQSKFHELSIKHRQLIETSPQVATIWNEVLVQQAADGHNAAAMQRLTNFDLRHTSAASGLASSSSPSPGSAGKLPGVAQAAAIFGSGQGMPPPMPGPSHYSSGACNSSSDGQPAPSTPMQQPPNSPSSAAAAAVPAAGGGPGPGQGAPGGPGPQQPLSSEERANALMAAVALEGLSPEASIAALQQLNYDLTMQLGLYQQMVSRLKDAMEQSDLEKAELEADKMALEMQLHGHEGGPGGSGGTRAGAAGAAGTARGGGGTWGGGLGFFRRSMGLSGAGPGPSEDLDEAGGGSYIGDNASLAGGLSLCSSRRSSADLDGVAAMTAAAAAAAAGGGSATSTPTKASADAAAAAAANGEGDTAAAAAAGASSGGAEGGGGGLFAARRARSAARAAAAAENLAKEVKELKRQLKGVQDENRYLVGNLVEIKMELAEMQGSHDQAKRALLRAMDKEACLDTKVAELTHMLDMATHMAEQQQLASGGSSMPSLDAAAGAAAGAAMAVAAAAKAAVAAASAAVGTPPSAKAAKPTPFSPEHREGGGAGGGNGSQPSSATAAAAAAHEGPFAAGVDDAAAAAGDGAGDAAAGEAAAGGDDGAAAAAAAAGKAGAADGSAEDTPPPAVTSFQLSESSSSAYEDADEEGTAADSTSKAGAPAPAAAREQGGKAPAAAADADSRRRQQQQQQQ